MPYFSVKMRGKLLKKIFIEQIAVNTIYYMQNSQLPQVPVQKNLKSNNAFFSACHERNGRIGPNEKISFLSTYLRQ